MLLGRPTFMLLFVQWKKMLENTSGLARVQGHDLYDTGVHSALTTIFLHMSAFVSGPQFKENYNVKLYHQIHNCRVHCTFCGRNEIKHSLSCLIHAYH